MDDPAFSAGSENQHGPADFSPWSFQLLAIVIRECLPRVRRIELTVADGERSASTLIDLVEVGAGQGAPPT